MEGAESFGTDFDAGEGRDICAESEYRKIVQLRLKEKYMDHFELVSEYAPTGDQPQAIAELVKGFKEGNQFETLLGVTGSGKTYKL